MQIDANTVIVVTGGASGMGAATVKKLAALGAKIAILDCAMDLATQIATEINGLAIECDVSDAASIEGAFATIVQQLGAPRICVNCAGIAPAKKIVGKQGVMPLSDFNQVVAINLSGTFNAMRLAAAHMIELASLGDSGERGVIINTASVAAYEGQIGQAAYSASKGGIVALTLPAARELARYGIRVNTIAPGLIATPMLLNMPQEVQASLSSTVPFPQRFGRPDEFAKLVAHVIDNEMINGEVIRLDGALRMAAR